MQKISLLFQPLCKLSPKNLSQKCFSSCSRSVLLWLKFLTQQTATKSKNFQILLLFAVFENFQILLFLSVLKI